LIGFDVVAPCVDANDLPGLPDAIGAPAGAVELRQEAADLEDNAPVPDIPEIRYARSGDVHIAYQTWGEGPPLVGILPFVQNIEALWSDPSGLYPGFLRRFGSFATVTHFDKRGTGLSDRVGGFGVEERMDDLRVVMDAVGYERAFVGGISEGGPMAMLFAATVDHGRELAQTIANARYVELPGDDHVPWVGEGDAVLEEFEEFMTGQRHRRAPTPDRVLATVLFTDIVSSTERAAALGDQAWRKLLDRHDQLVRECLRDEGGRQVKTTGDGFLATFDSPSAAVRAATAIRVGRVRPAGAPQPEAGAQRVGDACMPRDRPG
jgi:hypothetical protein